MPLTKKPKAIQSLPDEAQDVWVEVFNDAWKRLKEKGVKDEKQLDQRAAKIAWTAVKNGWTKRGGKWVRKSSAARQDVLRAADFLLRLVEMHGAHIVDE